MNPAYKLISLMLFLLLFSCNRSGDPALSEKISAMEDSVNEKSSQKEIEELFSAYDEFIASPKESPSSRRKMLKKAYELAKKSGNSEWIKVFATRSLIDFPKDKGREDKAFELIVLHEKERKTAVANILKLAYIEAFPDSPKSDSLKLLIPQGQPISADSAVAEIGKMVKLNPGSNGINSLSATIYVDACKAYATILSDREQSPKLLFNAAQLTTTMQQFDKTIELYDWIVNKYPEMEDAPVALATKGFILDNDLKDTEKAKTVYRQFIEEYPDHALTGQIQFLLENLGKSNEELLKQLNPRPNKQ